MFPPFVSLSLSGYIRSQNLKEHIEQELQKWVGVEGAVNGFGMPVEWEGEAVLSIAPANLPGNPFFQFAPDQALGVCGASR